MDENDNNGEELLENAENDFDVDLSNFVLPGLEDEAKEGHVTRKEQSVMDVTPEKETTEQRLRKEKGSSRVDLWKAARQLHDDQLDGVGLVYGDSVILSDASYSVSNGDRVGLVGPNGSGKTTQLKTLQWDGSHPMETW